VCLPFDYGQALTLNFSVFSIMVQIRNCVPIPPIHWRALRLPLSQIRPGNAHTKCMFIHSHMSASIGKKFVQNIFQNLGAIFSGTIPHWQK
jgi:hypothetical protein